MNTRKVGRPTDSPKVKKVQAKLDEDTLLILTEYCQTHGVNESEAIRRGIRKLNDYLAKE